MAASEPVVALRVLEPKRMGERQKEEGERRGGKEGRKKKEKLNFHKVKIQSLVESISLLNYIHGKCVSP